MLALLIVLALVGALRGAWLFKRWWPLMPRRNADFNLL